MALDFGVPAPLAALAGPVALSVSGFGFFRFLVQARRTTKPNDYVSQCSWGKVTRFHPLLQLTLSFRHTLWALPLVTGAITLLNWGQNERFTFPFAGGLAGLVLPAASHQAFFAFLVYLAGFAVVQLVTRSAIGLRRTRAVAFATLFGFAIHGFRYVDLVLHGGIFGVETNSQNISGEGELVPLFGNWWHTAGLFVVVVLVLSWTQLSSRELALFAPSAGVFALLNFWRMQPLVQYNMLGIFPLFYPVGSVVFLAVLWRLSRKPPTAEGRGAAAAVCLLVVVSVVLSGVMGTVRHSRLSHDVWVGKAELLGEWLRSSTPTDAVFVELPPTRPSVISTMAGRQLWVDSPEVWPHFGVNATDRELALKAMLKAGQLPPEVSFAVVASGERVELPSWWQQVKYLSDWSVYERRQR
jgi:hypothetical protein